MKKQGYRKRRSYNKQRYYKRRSHKQSQADSLMLALVLLVALLAFLFRDSSFEGFIAPTIIILPALVLLGYAAHLYHRFKTAQERENEYASHFFIEQMLRMPPDRFERLVAWVFDRKGYKAKVVGQTGDHGLDIMLKSKYGNAVAQVKRYALKNRVPEKEVRDFYGSFVDSDAVRGYFVTTSNFTIPARKWAKNTNKPLHLIDGKQLLHMVQTREESSWRELLMSQVLRD